MNQKSKQEIDKKLKDSILWDLRGKFEGDIDKMIEQAEAESVLFTEYAGWYGLKFKVIIPVLRKIKKELF